MTTRLGWLIALGACAVAFASTTYAHPFHTSTAEVEFNRESKRFEVAIKLLATDFEEAMTRWRAANSRLSKNRSDAKALPTKQTPNGSPRVRLESAPDVQDLMKSYLSSHFQITNFTTDQSKEISYITPSPENTVVAERVVLENAPNDKELFHWVGMEVEGAWVWSYFEIEAPAEGNVFLLRNTLFTELNSDQINTCTLKINNSVRTIRNDAAKPESHFTLQGS